jgi:hypothetical protein
MTRRDDPKYKKAQYSEAYHLSKSCSLEVGLASKIRHSVIAYLNYSTLSKSEFYKITGMSGSYADQLFEKQHWELTEAVRLAGFLKMNIETIVHWPKSRQF